MASMRRLGFSLVYCLCAAAELPVGGCTSATRDLDTFLLQTRVQKEPPPSSIVDHISDAIDDVHGEVTDAITEHIDNVGEMLKGTADVLADAVTGHIQKVHGVLSGTAEQLQETLSNISTTLAGEVITTVATLSKSVHNLTGQARSGITGLRDVTGEQGNAISQGVEDAGEAFQALTGTLIEAVDGAVSTMVGSMKELAHNLTGSLGDLSQDVVSPSLQTLDSQITATADLVGHAAKQFSEALSSARDRSVAAAEMGAQATETLVNVTQDNLSVALDKGDDLAQAIQQQLAVALAFLTGEHGSFLEGDVTRSSLVVAQHQAASAMKAFRADVRSICDALRDAALPRK